MISALIYSARLIGQPIFGVLLTGFNTAGQHPRLLHLSRCRKIQILVENSTRTKKVKLFLKLLFGFIFIFMVVMTIRTSLQVSLWSAIPSFAASPWSMATLYDAYFGFITFFCWLAWRERSLGIKVVWFVLIMALGNIAMSFYVLLQLFSLRADEPASALFRQKIA
ncbi:MAG: DUF1475 family protein [Acidobacteria bacterium]|nr:DUF1475 family protein [Acidobacteriota bacterium]